MLTLSRDILHLRFSYDGHAYFSALAELQRVVYSTKAVVTKYKGAVTWR